MVDRPILLPVRCVEIVERGDRHVRSLRVFCPRSGSSTETRVCATCAFSQPVSESSGSCVLAGAGPSEDDESEQEKALFLGPDALAARTPLGSVCASRSTAVRDDVSVADARALLVHNQAVVVLAANDEVRGLLTPVGALESLAPLDAGASRTVVLPESAPLVEAMEVMVHTRVRLLPVTAEDGRFVGLVADLDVLRWAARRRGTGRSADAASGHVACSFAPPMRRPAMSTRMNELKIELKKGVALLQTMRDEVRVRLHLAGMEAKERWRELEPRLKTVERAAQEASEASRAALAEAVQILKEFRDSLH